MTAQQLRNSILQQAIQGRLVPQDPNDEPASVLLERIRKEKEQLVKEGKLKKKDLIITPIADEEKPFDIPSGWEWCNLGNILSIVTGKKDANQGCENGPYPFFTCSMTPIRSTTYSFEGEAILLPGNGANVGMSILYDGKFEVYQRTYVLQSLCDNCLFLPYIKLALDWNWKQYNDDKLYGSAIPYIKLSNLQNYIFPLPPLAEQRRIVAKIEELMPLVEKYGKAQTELDTLNQDLPRRLRQSVLQQAIQGKLVEQDEKDEPASVLLERIRKEKEQLVKEGKLKKKDLIITPIADEEKPFDIPSGWEWCNLGNILSIVTGKKDANQGCENGPYPFFTCSMTPIRSTTYSFEGEAILLPGNGANVGMSILYDGKFEVYQRTYVLQSLCDNCLFLPYIKLALDWNWKQYNDDKLYGSAIPYIKLSNLQNYIFPLPPLAEQRRIVAKIEKLFAEIDKLK